MSDGWLMVLAGLFGAIGFLLAYLLQRMGKAAHVRIQFRAANEDLVQKIHALVQAKNEVLLLELEVAELVEKVQPLERAKWVHQMSELAHAVPPLVLQQMRRFGLHELPPEEPPMTAEQIATAINTQQNGAVEATDGGVVIAPSAWTGRQ